jgi:Fe-S-cluster containining protein
MCCNGVIFADVKLKPGDDPAQLRGLGLQVKVREGQTKFSQPCSALDGCRCRIYSERPKYCREFECVLLKSVKAGRLGEAAAMRIIRAARRRVEKVNRLLGELGDRDERADLRGRFRRTARKLEQADLDEKTRRAYGQLTLAMHDLNGLLSDAFYPG